MSAPAEKLQDIIKEKSKLLQQAIVEGLPLEAIMKLIKDGADVNYGEYDPRVIFEKLMKNSYEDYRWSLGVTSLMLTTKFHRTDVAEYLIQNKADVNASTNIGLTALMFAGMWKSPDIADLLIKAGAAAGVNLKSSPTLQSVYKTGDFDQTPLHLALQFRGPKYLYSLPLVKILLAAGADINAEGLAGITPFGLAMENEYNLRNWEKKLLKVLGVDESNYDNGIKDLREITQLLWKMGPTIGKTRLDLRGDTLKNNIVTSSKLLPEAYLVAQAEYCIATHDLDLSDIPAFQKFIQEKMGVFAKPIMYYLMDYLEQENKKQEARSSSDKGGSKKSRVLSLLQSAGKFISGVFSQDDKKNAIESPRSSGDSAGDSKAFEEQIRADLESKAQKERKNFIEAVSNLTPPHSSKIYSLLRHHLPCSFNVSVIVIDYHGHYLQTGFHPMINQLRKARLKYLEPQGDHEEPKASLMKLSL